MTRFGLLVCIAVEGFRPLQGRWSLPALRLTGRSGSLKTRFRLSCLYVCAGPPASAGPLVTASAAPHCPFRLTDDALQAVGLYGCAGLLASAGPLVTASAAPHWPFRLTDDALQAVVPVWLCRASGLCKAAGNASAVLTGRSGSLMTRFRLLACMAVQGFWPLQGRWSLPAPAALAVQAH